MNLRRISAGVNNRVQRYISENRGWKTDRRILVIESDDWGSIRMPSKEVYNVLLKNGISVDKCSYESTLNSGNFKFKKVIR